MFFVHIIASVISGCAMA
ncbi:type I toxin-antitoxin system Fst family toxin [Staphylococcus xylosus]